MNQHTRARLVNENILSKWHPGSRGGGGGWGKHLKTKLKYTSFIILMTDDLILSIFRTHAQNVYHKV